MRLLHNDRIIVNNVIVYDNPLFKFFGLRFSNKLDDEAAFFVNNKESRINSMVDMFFVNFPLDILWLDKDMKIVDKKTLKPFTIKISRKKAMYVLELEKDKAKGMKIGDPIKIE